LEYIRDKKPKAWFELAALEAARGMVEKDLERAYLNNLHFNATFTEKAEPI